jgi:hypothetical protein
MTPRTGVGVVVTDADFVRALWELVGDLADLAAWPRIGPDPPRLAGTPIAAAEAALLRSSAASTANAVAVLRIIRVRASVRGAASESIEKTTGLPAPVVCSRIGPHERWLEPSRPSLDRPSGGG